MKQYRKRAITVELLLLISFILNIIASVFLNQIPNISYYLANTYPKKNPNIMGAYLITAVL